VRQAALRGLCPENIIVAAHAGFSWWIDQTGARVREARTDGQRRVRARHRP
jgi:hypothetical protein